MKTPAADDPFGERTPSVSNAQLSVLGCDVSVDSTDHALLNLAIDAFGDLPRYRLGGRPPTLNVKLVLTYHERSWLRDADPPRPVLSSGNGLLCATTDPGNFAIVDVPMSRALICVSADMLQYPYHARYELIELAFLTLASRARSLVPLHTACVGSNGSGLLLMGSTGTGKSTLGLHALALGMQFLADDSAFVAPASLKITGVPNYLYLQRGTLDFLAPGQLRRQIQGSPKIRRRSGVQKYQANLRELHGKIARGPLQLAAMVMLSRRSVTKQPALKPVSRKTFLVKLRREQPYATGMSNWEEFERRIADVRTYELRRTQHPDSAVRELQALLG
ncbi:MAG: serine kinase [Woeseiaceae bacterium]